MAYVTKLGCKLEKCDEGLTLKELCEIDGAEFAACQSGSCKET